MKNKVSTILLLFVAQFNFAQDDVATENLGKFYVETAVTFSHFEQQVKSEIGGQKGDLIVDETNLSFNTTGGIKILPFLSAGAFFRYDRGNRLNSLFDGLDSNGQAAITQTLGGDYSEVWVGPFVRLHYQQLFLSLGYGLIGNRTDEGRNDIKGNNGNIDSFTLDPSVAWIFNLGGYIPLTDKFSVYFGLEYRARYYNQRGGAPLTDNIVFGTQNFIPLFGINIKL